jgi:predicted phosphohydrolase
VEADLEKELREFRLSIEHLRQLSDGDRPCLAMFHYPPFPAGASESQFTELIEEAGCQTVVYGHLHSEEDWARFFQGESRGVNYHLVSCDSLGFKPKLLGEY